MFLIWLCPEGRPFPPAPSHNTLGQSGMSLPLDMQCWGMCASCARASDAPVCHSPVLAGWAWGWCACWLGLGMVSCTLASFSTGFCLFSCSLLPLLER